MFNRLIERIGNGETEAIMHFVTNLHTEHLAIPVDYHLQVRDCVANGNPNSGPRASSPPTCSIGRAARSSPGTPPSGEG